MSPGADTIAAVATGPGRGGIGIIRVSGPLVPSIAQAMTGKLLRPRHATHTGFLEQGVTPLDEGCALLFEAPASFTGEDVLELHGHGSPAALDLVLSEVLRLGARLARPGEFCERAFLNGRMDLAQAEAVADLIESVSGRAARNALCTLQGELSRRVNAIVNALIETRVAVEAALDFPDEVRDPLGDGRLRARLEAHLSGLDELLAEAQRGRVLQEGLRVAIAGAPNVGKSSLLNLLAREDCAIVTEVPGTTRDPVRVDIVFEGVLFHITDTAGLRATDDLIEREGIRRARAALAEADLVLMLTDAALPNGRIGAEALAGIPGGTPVVMVHNKIDLIGVAPTVCSSAGREELYLSAKTGAGLALLEQLLKAHAGIDAAMEGGFSARRRHVEALERARAAVRAARLAEGLGTELVAEELRLAQRCLGEITGEFGSEELLGRIFSTFCIGK